MTAAAVYLRALDETDIENCLAWHNDRLLYATLGDPFRYVSRAAEINWLQRRSSYCAEEINLAICLQGTGEHIGNIYLRDIHWVSRRCTLSIFIGNPTQRGKGFGYSAVSQALRIAFLDLNLHRVFLEVLSDNVNAIKLYENCGFEVEGCLKEHAFKEGCYKDVLVMGVGASRFKTEPREQ